MFLKWQEQYGTFDLYQYGLFGKNPECSDKI